METTKTQFESMAEMIKKLPQHTCSSLKGRITLYKYQDFWGLQNNIEGAILAQQSFKARPDDVFLCSYPKSGTTWLKALAYAIVTREKFDEFTSPLLTNIPHNCIPYIEKDLKKIVENQNNSCFTPMATHMPYHVLPKSILALNCKMVYIYRNIKDVIVSFYHFGREITKLPLEDAPFEEAFDEFYHGISQFGPYWDHLLGYWKASLERPEVILFLKYEDVKKDPTSNVKRLAEFIGYPFTFEEEKEGVIESIIKLCSFENLSNLEVNKSGNSKGFLPIENRLYFRKAKDGDWKNYFTDEMTEKIDKLIDEKLSATGLVLK
uniref:Flavonol 4'-sulfotransferase n=1 Tax=Flaveria chlorifolia TaxID=4228 RepID=F4ST_FLACH|nr:RecName: Full=Flavonol 4'-sulfotransferase; Short=F4-ST [Flaveria chlorifolia]AAA33343.1 flavonol 4'-sulfotransferase [Flaveria chlorifolia]